MYRFDKRVVITLDAGGTNFVFGAMQSNEYIVEPISMPSNAHDLDLCLATMVKGFEQVIAKLDEKPVAISFAFPGPADYPNGIIGGYLPNFPSFRDGVALGPFLEDKFGIPVYINNDGDLFAFGEALGGVLPEINSKLEQLGSTKRYKNLLGFTFGTGFGVGSVIDNHLNRGNNSAVEIFCFRHKNYPEVYVEEGVAVRAIKRVYAKESGDINHTFEPKDIFDIAEGNIPGNVEAAKRAFEEFGEVAGDAIAQAVALTDSLVVIGGGLSAAKKYYMPSLMKQLRGVLHSVNGEEIPRLPEQAFELDDDDEFAKFAHGAARPIKVYGSEKTVVYDPMKCTGVAISKLGASKAISIGAYAFALSTLDEKE